MTLLPSRMLRATLVLLTLCATSCIDIREEFWVHEDGSAEAEIRCLLPRAAALVAGGDEGIRKLVDELLVDDPNVDSYEVRILDRDRIKEIHIRLKIEQLLRLDRLRETLERNQQLPEAVRHMVGSLDVGMDGLAVKVTRRISPGEAAPALKWLPAAQMEGHSLTQIIHFPDPVRSSNAHRVEDGGRTIIWETSLADAIQGPVTYAFCVALPIPWAWIGALAAVILLGTVWWMRRRRRLRARN